MWPAPPLSAARSHRRVAQSSNLVLGGDDRTPDFAPDSMESFLELEIHVDLHVLIHTHSLPTLQYMYMYDVLYVIDKRNKYARILPP